MYTYYFVARDVEPKRQRLREAEAQLAINSLATHGSLVCGFCALRPAAAKGLWPAAAKGLKSASKLNW